MIQFQLCQYHIYQPLESTGEIILSEGYSKTFVETMVVRVISFLFILWVRSHFPIPIVSVQGRLYGCLSEQIDALINYLDEYESLMVTESRFRQSTQKLRGSYFLTQKPTYQPFGRFQVHEPYLQHLPDIIPLKLSRLPAGLGRCEINWTRMR